MQKITFEENKVKILEDEYKRIPLTDDVKEKITHMAKLFENALPTLSFLALKGTILYSLQDWQKKSKTFSDDINSLPVKEKLQAIMEINNIVKERTKRLLKNKDDEIKIDQVFEIALQEAKKMFGI